MAKRFTDSDKWKDPWFISLSPINRLFWIFALDTCDHAGIWKDQLSEFNFRHNCELTHDDIKANFAGRIIPIDGETFIIPKFIFFQYPNFNAERNNAHKGVMRSLEYYGLSYEIIYNQFKNSRIKKSPTLGASEELGRGTGIGIGTRIGIGLGKGIGTEKEQEQEQNRTDTNAEFSKLDYSNFFSSLKGSL